MSETMYVRFGAAPGSGQSINDETGIPEDGVSCYRAEWQSTDRDVICIHVADEASAATAGFLEQSRPLYLIEGDRLDVLGSDGEPLLVGFTCTPLNGVEIINYCVEGEQ